jgi:hypothetical protein
MIRLIARELSYLAVVSLSTAGMVFGVVCLVALA